MDYKPLFINFFPGMQVQNQVNIERRGGFDINLMFQCFVDDMIKVIALGAVAVMIIALIVIFLNGPVKQVLRFFDLIADLWQIDKPERCSMFFNQVFQ